MQPNFSFYILAALHAALTFSRSIPWPRVYDPTELGGKAMIARAVTYDEYGEPISTEATGCVQVHCGASRNTVPDFKTYYEITLSHNGQVLLYLVGTNDQKQTDKTIKWSGASDLSGNKWGVRMTGDCGKIEYINTLQSSDGFGYYALNQIASDETDDEGPCFGESRTGKPRCLKATLWESAYTDQNQCGSFPAPSTCDFKGRCVDVNGVPIVKPEGF